MFSINKGYILKEKKKVFKDKKKREKKRNNEVHKKMKKKIGGKCDNMKKFQKRIAKTTAKNKYSKDRKEF